MTRQETLYKEALLKLNTIIEILTFEENISKNTFDKIHNCIDTVQKNVPTLQTVIDKIIETESRLEPISGQYYHMATAAPLKNVETWSIVNGQYKLTVQKIN